ncbi:helix-turn-helix domain-containing protein [Sphaerisporangium krabiense]|nr:helix-turn-helix domain-containing protein [Sphaerisporangium krabiense]
MTERGLTVRTLLTTDDVPATERVESFRAAILKESAPAELYTQNDTDFWGRMDRGSLGSLLLTRMDSGSAGGRRGLRRDAGLIRRSDPSQYQFLLLQQGSTSLSHNGRQVDLFPGDMTLIDSSRPYDGWHEAGAGRYLTVQFPRELLPAPRAAADRLVGGRLRGQAGMGALVFTFATRAAGELDRYSPADTARVTTTLLDLLGGLISHELEAGDVLPAESHRRVLLQRIQAYIVRHLGDRDLTPAAIAQAHHISTRTLHRLFEGHGQGVAAWIRALRLEHCRRDLVTSVHDGRPVHAVAARWGFHAPAHFTRAFRGAFGVSPLEFRRRAAASAPSP